MLLNTSYIPRARNIFKKKHPLTYQIFSRQYKTSFWRLAFFSLFLLSPCFFFWHKVKYLLSNFFSLQINLFSCFPIVSLLLSLCVAKSQLFSLPFNCLHTQVCIQHVPPASITTILPVSQAHPEPELALISLSPHPCLILEMLLLKLSIPFRIYSQSVHHLWCQRMQLHRSLALMSIILYSSSPASQEFQ